MTLFQCPVCKRMVGGAMAYFGDTPIGVKRRGPHGWFKTYRPHTVRSSKTPLAQQMKKRGWVPAYCRGSDRIRK